MVIARVGWADCIEYIRDPVRRGNFVCGVQCSELGISVRTEGCTEDAELWILRSAITFYEEMVMS